MQKTLISENVDDLEIGEEFKTSITLNPSIPYNCSKQSGEYRLVFQIPAILYSLVIDIHLYFRFELHTYLTLHSMS